MNRNLTVPAGRNLTVPMNRSLTAPTYATGIGLVLLGFEEDAGNGGEYGDTRQQEAQETLSGPRKFLQKIKDFFEDEVAE